jgi:hypothetical protein
MFILHDHLICATGSLLQAVLLVNDDLADSGILFMCLFQVIHMLMFILGCCLLFDRGLPPQLPTTHVPHIVAPSTTSRHTLANPRRLYFPFFI